MNRSPRERAVSLIILVFIVTGGFAPLLTAYRAAPGGSIAIALGSDVLVNNYTTGDQIEPAIATSPSGAIYVAWSSWNQTRWEIRFRNSTNGVNFSPEKRVDTLSNLANQSMPELAYASGVLYLVWVSRNATGMSIFLRTSQDGGATFTNATQIDQGPPGSDQTSPAIAAYQDNVYVSWMDNRSGNWDIYIRTSHDRGVTFEPELQVTASPADQTRPSIALNGSDQVLLAWEDARSGDTDIFASMSWDIGQTFTLPVRVNDDSTMKAQHNPRIGTDHSGRIWLFWLDQRDKFPRTYYTVTNNITRISFNAKNMATQSSQGDMGVALTTVPTLFWKNLSSKKVMFSQYNMTFNGFVSESPLTVKNWTQFSPSATASLNGSISVVWEDTRRGDNDIFLKQGDGTGPMINVASPLNDQVVNSTGIDIQYSCYDPSGMPPNSTSISYTLDWLTWITIASSQPNMGTFHWMPSIGITGGAGIRVAAYDWSGNPTAVDVQIYLDSTAPFVIQIQPLSGAKNISISTQVSLRFSEEMNRTTTESGFSLASDGPPVAGVFAWSGNLMKFTPNSLLLVGHEYLVRVVGARDLAGNQIALPIESRFVTIDLWSPKVEVIAPKTNDIWNSQPHEIKYSIVENGTIPVGGININYSKDNGTSWLVAGSGLNNTGSYSWSIPSGLDTKDALIRVEAKDLAGNIGSNVSGKFKIDSIIPRVNSTSPSNSSINVPVTTNVSITFTEAMNKTSVERSFVMTGPSGIVSGGFKWNSTTYTFSPLKSLDSYSAYWYNFSGMDVSGNVLQQTSVQFRTTDIRGPVITILSPLKDQYVNGTGPFLIRYTIYDESSIRPRSINISVSYDSSNWNNIASGWSNTTSFLWSPIKNVEFPHVWLKVEATDSYGNIGSSRTSDSFILDTLAPKVKSSDPKNGTRDVPLTPEIAFTFNEKMNRTKYPDATILPYVELSTTWISNDTLLLKPKTDLRPGTQYSIQISWASDPAGNPIQPYNLTFITTFQTIRGSIIGFAVSLDKGLLSDVDVIARLNGSMVKATKTASNGNFNLTDLEPGDYQVTLHKEGYYNATKSAKVSVGNVTNLWGIVLVPVPKNSAMDILPIIVLIAAVIALAAVVVIVYIRSKRMEETEEFVRHLTSVHAKETTKKEEKGKEEEKKPEEKGLEIELGESYLLAEKGSENGYREFSYLIMSGLIAVCITARSPRLVWEKELSMLSKEKKDEAQEGSQPYFFLDLATRAVEMKGFEKKKTKGEEAKETEKKSEEKKEEEDEEAPATMGRVEFVMVKGKKKPEAKTFSKGIWRFMMEHQKNVVYIDSLHDFITAYGASANDMITAMLKEAEDTKTTFLASLGDTDQKTKDELEDMFENVYQPEK